MLLSDFNLKQRIFIVKSFYKNKNRIKNVIADFQRIYMYLTKPPTEEIVQEIINLFEEFGNVAQITEVTKIKIENSIVEEICVQPEIEFVQVSLDVKDEYNPEPEPQSEITIENENKSLLMEIENENDKQLQNKNILEEPKEDASVKSEFISVINHKIKEECIPEQQVKSVSIRIDSSHQNIWTCVRCKTEFTQLQSFRTHMKTHEKKCTICNKITLNLEGHMKSKHKNSENFVCPTCGKLWKTNVALLRHIATHTEAERFTCEICSKSLKTRYTYNDHMKLHTQPVDREKFKCEYDQCSKGFSTRAKLNKHVKCHKSKEIICDICGKGLTGNSSLKQHMIHHTGERPFECKLCHKRYSARCTLKLHMRTHTGERPYKCEYCEKGFIDKTNLTVHIRSHTGEEPYKCELCGKTCKQRQNLKSHMRHIHYKNVVPKVKANV